MPARQENDLIGLISFWAAGPTVNARQLLSSDFRWIYYRGKVAQKTVQSRAIETGGPGHDFELARPNHSAGI